MKTKLNLKTDIIQDAPFEELLKHANYLVQLTVDQSWQGKIEINVDTYAKPTDAPFRETEHYVIAREADKANGIAKVQFGKKAIGKLTLGTFSQPNVTLAVTHLDEVKPLIQQTIDIIQTQIGNNINELKAFQTELNAQAKSVIDAFNARDME